MFNGLFLQYLERFFPMLLTLFKVTLTRKIHAIDMFLLLGIYYINLLVTNVLFIPYFGLLVFVICVTLVA